MVKNSLINWQQQQKQSFSLILVGLGNNHSQYLSTHHNLGWMWLDFLVQRFKTTWSEDDLCFWAIIRVYSCSLLLLKLKTEMNLSGFCLWKLVTKSSLDLAKVIVWNDNLDLDFSKFKFTKQIPDNGHQGLFSIIKQFKTKKVMTCQLGISKQKPIHQWVLQPFSAEKKRQLKTVVFPHLSSFLLQTIQHWDGIQNFVDLFYQQLNSGKKTVNLAVIGGQWGDEGKGKIVDYLTSTFAFASVARFSGGDNAGHTVQVQKKVHHFSLLPVSITHSQINSVIGSGCLLNLETLINELKVFSNTTKQINLVISPFCHLVMPYHLLLDQLQEKERGKNLLGTTQRGIGPCLEDKVKRCGVRLGDLFFFSRFQKKLQSLLVVKNQILVNIYQQKPLAWKSIYEQFCAWFKQIKVYIQDDLVFCQERKNQPILFEGAQGSLLDLNLGTYPFVTSSSTLSYQVGSSFGNLFQQTKVLGVFKTYASRVGQGPFPTELRPKSVIAKHLVMKGCEFGVVTRRQRRVGWFDAVLAKYACQINGFSEVALTLLDVWSGCQEIKICTGYWQNGKLYQHFSSELDWNQPFSCQYLFLPGWSEEIKTIKSFANLPVNAQKYVIQISQLLDKPVTLISVGKGREEVITLTRKEVKDAVKSFLSS